MRNLEDEHDCGHIICDNSGGNRKPERNIQVTDFDIVRDNPKIESGTDFFYLIIEFEVSPWGRV